MSGEGRDEGELVRRIEATADSSGRLIGRRDDEARR